VCLRLTSSMNWICEPGTPVKSANMLPVTLAACHPERSEGSRSMGAERCFAALSMTGVRSA